MKQLSYLRQRLAGYLLAACICCIGGIQPYAHTATTAAALTPIPGDINGDGVVNVGDLQLLVAAWGATRTPPSANWNPKADLNNDGVINVGDLQLLVANWGASVSVTIQKDPLGRSTSLGGQVVGKVYVPSRYGGQLTLSGSNIQLFYTDGSDLQSSVAAQIYTGGLSGSVVAQGNPCSYTVPLGKPGWYYIRPMGSTPATVASSFEEDGQASYRPWNGWWWPWNTSQGPTLYDFGGPLDKYDHVYGTSARSWEASNEIGGQYWFGHCWGWSIAAILMPAPQATAKKGVSFTMDDMKGLYTQLADSDPYFDATLSIAFIPPGPPTSSPNEDVDAYCDDLYRILRTCIREEGVPVQSDMRAIATPPAQEEEVWNQSIYKYTSNWVEAPGQTNEHVAQIDMVVSSNFGPWPPPTTYTNDRVEEFVYQLEFDAQGQVNAASPAQNWISASHYPPHDLYRLTGSPWTGHNPWVTKPNVDGLYQP